MRLQKILDRFLRLHPKKIDLSLDRINKLLSKLGNPQNDLSNVISIVGTNGKYSTIQALRSIYEESGKKCNLYLSPHVKKINERFVFDSKEISNDNLVELLSEIEKINNNDPITFFEILTAAFLKLCSEYKDNITLVEAGLFHNFDATNIFKKNLASIICILGMDHNEWLPKNDQTIDRIIYEKTTRLLESKIIISEQSSQKILDKIEKLINKNKSEKIFFKKDFNYLINENGFVYYEDKYGGIKFPNLNFAEFQISNIATAISASRNIKKFNISDENIKKGITKVKSIARLEEIKSGKLKKIAKNCTLLMDGAHNEIAAISLSKHLKKYYNNKKIIMCLGMMSNKSHKSFVNYFKGVVDSIITFDIPNQQNSISKENLKKVVDELKIKSSTSNSLTNTIDNISKNNSDCIILISGSLYFCGEVLKIN